MQAARDLVALLVKFAAGMQLCHHNLNCRPVQLRMVVHWYAAAIVYDSGTAVFMQNNPYPVAIACQCLIDGVVYSLIYKMVQPLYPCSADIHAGPFSYSAKSC